MVLVLIIATLLIVFDIFLVIRNIKLEKKIEHSEKEIIVGDYD